MSSDADSALADRLFFMFAAFPWVPALGELDVFACAAAGFLADAFAAGTTERAGWT
jgi:hypothetical protein